MNNQTAKNILQELAKGVHPKTGADLPTEAVIHDPAVIRALITAVATLDAHALRDARRKMLPPGMGKAWNEEEKQQLVAEFESGMPKEAIAAAHGRTLRAIESRLEVMGLITAEQRVTKNRDSQ